MAVIIGLAFLNRLGITQFNSLPVIAFALNAEAQKFLTPNYSYSLAMTFRPHVDYRADIVAVKQPFQVLVGKDNEVFYAERFSLVFQEAGKTVPVIILPEVGHSDIILKPSAINAVTAAMEQLEI